jgi:arginyl-tRNA--protein-N-Asp/Glu arginylyltransferase
MAIEYFSTGEKTLQNPTDDEINAHYDQGFVFTRVAKGHMNQTRSLRIDLAKFSLTSENRRILRKSENLSMTVNQLPLTNYTWEIHKLGKDFYTTKFGDNVMSASKIKEMFNDMEKSNMNYVFSYRTTSPDLTSFGHPLHQRWRGAGGEVGYCLAYINKEVVHYAYPFYDLNIAKELPLGIGMMTKAINWAKENGKKYIYLGSVTTPESKYKLQFEGLEWYDADKNEWNIDLEVLKNILQLQKADS